MPQKALSAKRDELIERLRLTEAGMLKRAALLLFHEDPERWFTGAYVKIGMFLSESEFAYHDEVHGDLFTQMDQTVELLLTKYMVAWISDRRLTRLETFPIPEEALREALLNALIHKDYSSGRPSRSVCTAINCASGTPVTCRRPGRRRNCCNGTTHARRTPTSLTPSFVLASSRHGDEATR